MPDVWGAKLQVVGQESLQVKETGSGSDGQIPLLMCRSPQMLLNTSKVKLRAVTMPTDVRISEFSPLQRLSWGLPPPPPPQSGPNQQLSPVVEGLMDLRLS